MKILSIDGGGIKGLYSAAFLAGLESRFNRQMADCFDLIVGTSTGGILALALAAHIPAQDIVQFYRQWGARIFPSRLKFYRFLKSLFFAKYRNKDLVSALKDVFKELKLKDIFSDENPVALCIPSIDAITGTPWVFKTAHDPKLMRDEEYYLWQVALATSAAPTYLPIAEINMPSTSSSSLFIDGGLWANNPSLVALTEALTYGKSKLKDIYLLSLGNIKSNTSFRSNTLLNKGVLLWRQKVVNLTLETQSSAIENQIRLLFESFGLTSHYLRIEHETTSKNHSCLQVMDLATKSNLNDLEVYGRNRANHEGVKTEIMNFFTV